MHIPDGFLTPPIFISTWVAGLVAIRYSLRKIRQRFKEKMVPLMGVMAAFIFAGQMINFPVLAGTSGHLVGGMLAALTVGPYAACIIMSLVLAVQCFVFQDGGITSLGANILNMAVFGTIFSYGLYLGLKRIFPRRFYLVAVFLASWSSVVLSTVACGLELGFSGVYSVRAVVSSMVFVYLFIGIGEGLITLSILRFLTKARPDLIYKRHTVVGKSAGEAL